MTEDSTAQRRAQAGEALLEAIADIGHVQATVLLADHKAAALAAEHLQVALDLVAHRPALNTEAFRRRHAAKIANAYAAEHRAVIGGRIDRVWLGDSAAAMDADEAGGVA